MAEDSKEDKKSNQCKRHVPLKVNTPNGTPYTVCIVDSCRHNLLASIQEFDEIIGVQPHYQFAVNNNGSPILLRNVRIFSKQPVYPFLDYMIYMIRSYVNILDNLKSLGIKADNLVGAIRKCIRGELKLAPQIDLKKCIEWMHSHFDTLWREIVRRWLNDLDVNGIRYSNDALGLYWIALSRGGNKWLNQSMNETAKIFELVTLLYFSLFERINMIFLKYDIFNSMKKTVIEFNLIKYIGQLIQEFNIKNDSDPSELNNLQQAFLAWLIGFASYSGLGHYPLLTWYSTVYGTETPPASFKLYTYSKLTRSNLRPNLVIPETKSDTEYGYHDEQTLTRYTYRWYLDSITTSAAIDLYSTYLLKIPWFRANVHSSLVRTLFMNVNKNNPKMFANLYPIVIPALVPPDYVPEKIKMIPVPIESWHWIGNVLYTILSEEIHMVELLHGTRSMEVERLVRTALELAWMKLREAVNNERDHLRAVHQMIEGNECVHGIMVDAYHPVISMLLLHEIALRSAAEYPTPSLGINVLRVLMDRLSDADRILLYYYLIIDLKKIINEFLKANGGGVGMRIHIYATDSLSSQKTTYGIDSFNLERLLKFILMNYKKYKCAKEIMTISEAIWRRVIPK